MMQKSGNEHIGSKQLPYLVVRYQLVFQFSGSTLADYDAMITLEDRFIDVLGSSADVDGHDSGASECNIFVYTDRPAETFRQVHALLERAGALKTLRAAYRLTDGEDYTVLWPKNFTGEFSIA